MRLVNYNLRFCRLSMARNQETQFFQTQTDCLLLAVGSIICWLGKIMVCDCSIICATQQIVVLNNKTVVLDLPSENEWPLEEEKFLLPSIVTPWWPACQVLMKTLHSGCISHAKHPSLLIIAIICCCCGSHFKREFFPTYILWSNSSKANTTSNCTVFK